MPTTLSPNQSMKSLELTAVLERSEVIVGESLPLRVTVLNRGGQPAEIPNRLGPSEFEYVFRRVGAEGAFTVVSSDTARAQRQPERARTLVPRRSPLAAGDKAEYRVDPASFLVEPLPPGSYTVAAAFGVDAERVESPAVPLKVVGPRAVELATVTLPGTAMLSVGLIHLAGPQKATAFSYVSQAENSRHGIYYRRIETSPPETVTGIAVTTPDESTNQSWVAWLQGGVLSAGLTQGSTLLHAAKTPALGLRSATLHRVGWRPTADTALFAILGIDSQGKASLALAQFSHEGGPTVRQVSLDGGQMPTAWKIAHRADDAATLQVITADTAGNSTRVRSQVIALAGGVAAAPVMIVERAAPLLALSVDALGGPLAVVDLLFGPTGASSGLVLLRCALEGKGQPIEFSAPLPEGPAGTPSQWTLAARPLAEPVVAVKTGERLLARHFAEGRSWTPIATQSAAADHLRLEETNESLVAIWVDSNAGVKQVFVP